MRTVSHRKSLAARYPAAATAVANQTSRAVSEICLCALDDADLFVSSPYSLPPRTKRQRRRLNVEFWLQYGQWKVKIGRLNYAKLSYRTEALLSHYRHRPCCGV